MPQTRRALMIGIDSYPKIRGADLAGCVNDVALMKSILEDQFDFAPENIRTILDRQATRRNIKAGFEAFVASVQPDDIAVIYYAGHGSRMRDPRAPREIIESMVSHDSGRAPHLNRDVLDREVDGWVRAINAKTPHLTLIFDCCHSGGVTRDLFGGRTRRVEPDMRMPEDWTGEDYRDEALRAGSIGGTPGRRSSSPPASRRSWPPSTTGPRCPMAL